MCIRDRPYTEDTLLSAMENAGKEDMPDEAERKGLGSSVGGRLVTTLASRLSRPITSV